MKTQAIISALCLSMSAASIADVKTYDSEEARQIEVMQTGRYSKVKNIPPADQLNPLKVVIQTRIPQSVNTVGETVNFLLVRSGFTLADEGVLSEEAKTLLGLPLPQVHRNIGPMTLDNALHTLGGSAFELVVDPVHRKVAFELSTKLARAE